MEFSSQLKKIKKILLLLCLISLPSYSKILLFTYSYARPDFIELQYKSFKKFLHDDYEFIVFNDAPKNTMKMQIEQMCASLGLQCIRIPQKIHTRPYLPRPAYGPFAEPNQGSVRNCNVVQYSLNEVGFHHDDIVALLDSDMFLIKPFSIREYMKGYDAAGYKRMCFDLWHLHNCERDHRGKPPFGYFWIGIVFLNMATMPNRTSINFNCGFVEGRNHVDAGGFTYNYIKNNPEAKIKYFNRIRVPELLCNDCLKKKKTCIHNTDRLKSIGFNQSDINFLQHAPMFELPVPPDWISEYYLDGYFLHFRGGTREEIYSKKEAYVIPYLKKLFK